MRNSVIDGELQHFRINHDKPALLGRKVVKERCDHRIDCHRFSGSGITVRLRSRRHPRRRDVHFSNRPRGVQRERFLRVLRRRVERVPSHDARRKAFSPSPPLARASFASRARTVASTSRRTLKPTRAVPRRIFERFPSRRLARVVERARGGSNGSRKGLRTRFARDRSPRGRERRRLREDRRERNEPVDRRARADADFSK